MSKSQEEQEIAQPLLDDAEAASCIDNANHDPEEPLLVEDDPAVKPGKVAWTMMTFVMLGDMLGLGSLTLPTDFAQLGWAVAVPLVVLCGAGMLYSGRLFTIIGIQLPSARTFDSFGTQSLGHNGRRLVYFFVYGTVLLSPIMLQLTSVESLQQILFSTHIDRWTAGLIVAVLMVPLSMMQGLEDVAGLSLFGSLGMLVAIVVALAKLIVMEDPQPTEIVHRPTNFTKPIVAVLDIIFAYGGQQNWARFLTQMQHRRHFPRTVGCAAFVMSSIYILTGAIGYVRLGKTFDSGKPLTSVLPVDAVWTPIMNLGLFVHCILAYQINMNVWADIVLHLATPVFKWPASKATNPGPMIWGIVSVTGIALSFVVAALLPFFSTVAAVMAALGDLAGAYALPACFVLAIAGSSLSKIERGFLKVLVPVTFLLSGIGLAVSLYSLVLEVEHGI